MRLCRFVGMIIFLAGMVAVCAGTGSGPSAGDYMKYGLGYEARGEFEAAIVNFTKAIDNGELDAADKVLAVYDRAVAMDALNRTEEAIREYSSALDLKPDFAPALNNRANAYRRLGRLEDAKRDYWAALSMPGAAAEYAYFGLGQIAQSQGNAALARGFYTKALGIKGDFRLAAESLKHLGESIAAAAPQNAEGGEAAKIVLRPPPRKSARGNGGRNEAPSLRPSVADIATGGATKPPPRRAVLVQLGAFRDRETAEKGWSEIRDKSGGALADLSPIVVTADLPGRGRFFRLRTAVNGKAEAQKICANLAAQGLPCLPVRD
jgi:tetratricopeptide (TPR) repeat protein